jgi:hypothetical protein
MTIKQTFLILTTLLLAPPAALHASRTLPEVPSFGKPRVGSFRPLENHGATTSNDWNCRIK